MTPSPSTPRKRQKLLLHDLWDLQTDDVPMTAATLVEVKYLLRRCKRSACVTVETPRTHANELDPNPFTVDEKVVPKFILCQLLDQKLIESRNYQDTIALPAALSVILLTLSTEDSNKKHACPTQFRWHCSRTHRTHLIFAWLDISMKTSVYTIEELLNLRDAASPSILVDPVAKRDNELAEMLRTKSRVSSSSYNTNTMKRGYRKKADDSSTTSDEVIFKGTMNRRAFKIEAAQHNQGTGAVQSSQHSQTPQPLPSAQAVPTTMGNPKASVASASESDQPTEWKYRGRSGSELTSNEPMSAPTGLNAQQNEGFQRFYKAVVSPTHVRVTAGGRIVPNNRNNPVSPTAKRIKDGDTNPDGNQPETAAAAPPKLPMAPVMGMPHPMQFFYPGFHPGMAPMHPMAGMPMPMMPPGFPFPMPMSNGAGPPTGQDDSHKENLTKKGDDVDDKATVEAEPTKTGVKLSPPEQFDHSKPFMFNGQPWMFPMFPAPYPGFMGMPSPAFPPGPMPGSPMMMPPHMAMPGMVGGPIGPMGPMGPIAPMGPMGLQSQQGPPPTASVSGSSRQPTPQPSSKPPISSIRPSQITRKQIDGLRASLKYHEDQLQYNKHQIDEKDMETKIQMLLADIERFERVFTAQAEYEEKHYPKVEKTKEDSLTSGGRSSAPSTNTSQSQSEESKESKESNATSVTTGSQPKLRKKDRSCDSLGVSSNKSSRASSIYHEAPRVDSTQGRKSTLPSDAARAPVFQPRSVSAFTLPITNGTESITQEQLQAAEKRLIAAGSQGWNLSAAPSTSTSQNSFGVPYLVGTLPRGVNPYNGTRVEYEYSRKLTDEEVQARHLYWGKAPRSVSQGLPKYDGKNFYPPSPIKVPEDSSPKIRRGIPTGVPEIDYQFTAPNIDPFRAITPNESITKGQGTESLCKTPSIISCHSFQSQADDHAEELDKVLADTASTDLQSEASHTKGASETKSADFHDVRANGTATKIWQSVLKRGLTNSDVLPSTVSSTTAHGFLPHFSGHAAASLSPTISGAISSPSRGSPAKDHNINTNGTSTFMAQKPADTCPPATGERLSETLLNMVGMKAPAWAS